MKQAISFLLLLWCSQMLSAQQTEGFHYQAVLRDQQGQVISHRSVSLRLSLLSDTLPYLSVYEEVHQKITNEFGLVNLVMGKGQPIKGSFIQVDWAQGPYFLEVELDDNGGQTFKSLGAFQLQAVPYAYYAEHTAHVEDADADPLNEIQTLSRQGNNIFLSPGGGGVADRFEDADADPNNEIQVLTLVGDSLMLNPGGGVRLSQPWKENLWGVYQLDRPIGIGTSMPGAQLNIFDSLAFNRPTYGLYAAKVIPATYPTTLQKVALSTNEFLLSGTSYAQDGYLATVEVQNVLQNRMGSFTQNWGLVARSSSGYANYGLLGFAEALPQQTSLFNIGVFGEGNNANLINRGLEGSTQANGTYNQGVFGRADGPGSSTSTSENIGVLGYAKENTQYNYGTYGLTEGKGQMNVGAIGRAIGDGNHYNYGIYGEADSAVFNYAGFFNGDVMVLGNIAKSGGTFKIDHPLDPANQYLQHSFVESPEMLNIYAGTITTDQQGFATVNMPDYVVVINKGFCYQLTVMGSFAQAIISQEISGNQFVIQTDRPHTKVCWQVTGVRNDPWAQAHRVQVEVSKHGLERGRYMHPELYGRPKSEGLVSPIEHTTNATSLAPHSPLPNIASWKE